MGETTYSIYASYRDMYRNIVTNIIKFEYLKDKCNLTDEELEKFKTVLALIVKTESEYHVIMDDHGNSTYGAVILGQSENGILVFRKYGHICGEEFY